MHTALLLGTSLQFRGLEFPKIVQIRIYPINFTRYIYIPKSHSIVQIMIRLSYLIHTSYMLIFIHLSRYNLARICNKWLGAIYQIVALPQG